MMVVMRMMTYTVYTQKKSHDDDGGDTVVNHRFNAKVLVPVPLNQLFGRGSTDLGLSNLPVVLFNLLFKGKIQTSECSATEMKMIMIMRKLPSSKMMIRKLLCRRGHKCWRAQID